ncbi:MAG: MCP four helix bundle domain-containing protein [Burkholderiales bacterium]|nr:MCP four helix bundle domain-containing protein [Burkholderiales bacterium]
MQAFYDFKIATKLIIGFIAVLILTSFLGLFSISQLANVQTAATKIGNDWMPSSVIAMGLKESISRMRSQEAQMASAESTETAKKYLDRTNEAVEQFRKYHAEALKLSTNVEEKRGLDEAMSVFNDYVKISNKISSLASAGNAAEAQTVLRGESSNANKKLRELIDKMVEANMVGSKKAVDDSASMYAQARTMIWGVLVIAVVLGLSLAIWLANIVSSPLQTAVNVALSISKGDLTQTIAAESRCETGQLMQALADMNTNLLNIVSQVRQGTEQINQAAGAIAEGNLDLSQRTEEQASSLQETASSMEEITSTIKHNSDNARQANSMSKNATTIAEKGGAVVSEVVATMSSINESSRRIVDIISVIDGIAFQTNILALNAAVEAARAGEQGRGFAVVASEVRNLAQRSASAAKEIKELINNSVEKVDQGSRLVDTAGSTMQEVVESVKRVSDIISEITAAGDEQSMGVDQINQAISQMDSVTQQNAALVEEAAAAAAAMQEQAGKLVDVVSVFQLRSDHAPKASTKANVQAMPRKAATGAARKASKGVTAPKLKARPALEAKAGTDEWESF